MGSKENFREAAIPTGEYSFEQAGFGGVPIILEVFLFEGIFEQVLSAVCFLDGDLLCPLEGRVWFGDECAGADGDFELFVAEVLEGGIIFFGDFLGELGDGEDVVVSFGG